MLPFSAAAAAGSDPSARYVGSFFLASGTSPALSTIGAQPGDFAIYGSPNNPYPVSGAGSGGWSTFFSDGGVYYSTKRLVAADIAAGIHPSGAADFFVMIYRGAIATASIRASAGTTENTLTMTSVAKSAGHNGLVGIATNNFTFGLPTIDEFVPRGNYYYDDSGGSGTRHRYAGFDRLSPPNALFVDYAAITLHGFYGYNNSLTILELRSS